MKPYAIYGKKPRASKTSKREILNGIPVFLQSNASETKGNIVCYYDKPPFCRICVGAGNTYWECRTKIEEFFSKNTLEIEDAIKTLDKNFAIPRKIMDDLKIAEKYVIYDTSPDNTLGLKLITPFYNNKFIYLWIDMETAPTVNAKGSKVPDMELILDEYLDRKEKDE